MLIILCFDRGLKISTVNCVDDLFTFVNKLLNDPLDLLRILKYWTQTKALTLSFLFCSCSNCFGQKHGSWSENKNQNSVKNATIEMRPLVANFVNQNRTRYLCRSILVFWFIDIFRLDQKWQHFLDIFFPAARNSWN